MTDYKEDKNNIIFAKALAVLDLRQPNSKISKATGFSKGNISSYMNNKKPVSDNFLNALFDAYDLDKNLFITQRKQIDNKPNPEIQEIRTSINAVMEYMIKNTEDMNRMKFDILNLRMSVETLERNKLNESQNKNTG